MLEWPTPQDVKGLRGFLGLTRYYRKFVEGYGKIAWPLTQQLKKDQFQWSGATQEAFEKLKLAMTRVPVLAIPDFNKLFMVETDASGHGLGVVLMQEGHPRAYMSQTLLERNLNKSVYEKELMAVVMAVKKWQHYLMGRPFVIYTDKKSLKFLADQRVMGEGQRKWISKLMGFTFEIWFKPGTENSAADASSRKMQFAAVNKVHMEEWEELEDEVDQDANLKRKIQDLLAHKDVHKGYEVSGGRLYYKNRLVIPKCSPKLDAILKEFHDSAMGGHSGFFRTYKRISQLFYWEGMKMKIQEYVRSCEVCQRNKYQTLSPAGYFSPFLFLSKFGQINPWIL